MTPSFEFKDTGNKHNKKLFIDGEIVGDINEYDEDYIGLTIDQLDVIGKYTFNELFGEKIQMITIPCRTNLLGKKIILDELEWEFYYDNETRSSRVTGLRISFDTLKWNPGFSINKFVSEVSNVLEHERYYSIDSKTTEYATVEICRILQNLDCRIKEVFESDIFKVKEVIDKAISNILSMSDSNALVNKFEFPSEIKEACEQYLIYFSKFLADLGIGVETSIETTDQGSIFKVVPKDPKEALSKIKDALDVYLNLPGVPDLENQTAGYTNISVQQLASQVFHLKSQLLLAQSSMRLKEATIQAKDAAINSLNLTVYNQNQLIGEQQDEEEVLDGLATIKKIETTGISFNLPELFRRMKRKFK